MSTIKPYRYVVTLKSGETRTVEVDQTKVVKMLRDVTGNDFIRRCKVLETLTGLRIVDWETSNDD